MAIPRFKRDRGSQYFRFLDNFARSHQVSAVKNIEIWQKVMDKTGGSGEISYIDESKVEEDLTTSIDQKDI